MAKIKHNHFIDTVDEMLTMAKNEGTIDLYAEDKILTGRTLQINGTALFHFATTSYLGLEYDNRLKDATISAIAKYSTQFPVSKKYLSHPLYPAYLNDAMEQLEGQIASAKIAMARLSSPQLYYVLSGNDFTLDINNPAEPKIVCMGNTPQKIQIYGAVLSLYVSRLVNW